MPFVLYSESQNLRPETMCHSESAKINVIIIIIIIHRLNARRSPMSIRFLTIGEFPSYWDWLWCPSWAFARIGVHRPSVRLPYLVFSICYYLPLDSIMFPLYGRHIATHSVDPSLTHFLGEFPGFGLALVPDIVGPEAEQRCAWSRKLSKFLPWPG